MLPQKTLTGVAADAWKETGQSATEDLSARLHNGSVGDADDQSLVVLHAFPRDRTVWPSQRAQLQHLAVDPDNRLRGGIPGKIGRPHRPTEIVDRICRTRCSLKCVGQDRKSTR